MPGFLSSLFAQSTKETVPAPKTLEERLLDAGVTEEGARHFSEVIKNGGDFVFDARKEAHFPHRDIAIGALDLLLNAADGKTFKSFILVSLNNQICTEDPSKITVSKRMPDGTLVKQKAEPGMIRPYDLSALTEGRIRVKAECFGLKRYQPGEENLAGLADCIEASGASKLEFRETDISPFAEKLREGMTAGRITQLSVNFCDASEDAMQKMASGIESSSLTRFEMQMLNKGVGASLAGIIEALPPSLTYLALDNNMLRDAEKSALIKKLPDLKALRHLGLGDDEIKTRDIQQIASALPASLETMSLKENASILDEGTLALVDAMNTKNRLLHKTALFETDEFNFSLTGSAARKKAEEAEEANKAVYMEKVQRDKAAEIAYLQSGKTVGEKLGEARTPEEVKGLIFEAYAFGNVGDALKRMEDVKGTFTPEDLAKKNKDGLRMIDVLSVTRKIPELMTDKLIAGTKNLTTAYEMLCDTDKKLFDGKNGRPTFLKLKNQIMAAAVKQAVAAKRFERKSP